MFAAHSVGGEGWFAIFRIAHPEQHQAHFEALRQDFLHEGITIDRCCGDVSRMRIISYDPDPYVNENASIYNKVLVRPRPAYQPQPCTDDVIVRVESCCHEIVQKGVDVTATYDDWFHAGAALASLGERGRGLFHLISAQNGRYDALETDRKFIWSATTSSFRSRRRRRRELKLRRTGFWMRRTRPSWRPSLLLAKGMKLRIRPLKPDAHLTAWNP